MGLRETLSISLRHTWPIQNIVILDIIFTSFPDVGEDLLAMCEQNVALNKHLMEPGGGCCVVRFSLCTLAQVLSESPFMTDVIFLHPQEGKLK